ncbi:hypothetical protein AB1N83_014204, partial [Pleurotus pulmonarius]
FCT